MTDDRGPGIEEPGHSQQWLQVAAAAEKAAVDDLVAVDQAENVVGRARLNELAETVKTARRRLDAALAQLGGSDELSEEAAQAAAGAAADHLSQVAAAAVAEMHTIAQARITGIRGVLTQIGRAQSADAASDQSSHGRDIEDDHPRERPS